MPAPIPPALLSNLNSLEDALRAALADGPPELIRVSRYVMGWDDADGQPITTGGKRIRPALALHAATLFGAQADVAMPGAVAVELIHNFSLVHDEVQDHDAERHHRPTVWALHGEGQAINAGDFLITRAIASLVDADVPAERSMAALRILNDAMARMIAGQWADISFESRHDVTTAEYLEMVRGKTGALLGAPLAIGATLAGASPEQAAALGEWGEAVGLAFQVHDDYLGIWGDPNITGKSNTGDIARRKKTLPIVYGLSSSAANVIRYAYALPELSEADIQRVVTGLEGAGSAKVTRDQAQRLAAAADQLLESFELPEASRQELRSIGAYLIDRDR
jgi:geranylgeranyl diphosphate synthase type I